MKVIKDFGEYFKYSLHDARINRIEYKQRNIILHFNYIFSYDENVERTHKAQIILNRLILMMFVYLYLTIGG